MTWEPYIHQSSNIVAARTMVLQKETSKLEYSSEHEEQKDTNSNLKEKRPEKGA
jgi:hypothetical protein